MLQSSGSIDIKDFYQFTTDDIKITDYVTGEQIKDIPIAV